LIVCNLIYMNAIVLLTHNFKLFKNVTFTSSLMEKLKKISTLKCGYLLHHLPYKCGNKMFNLILDFKQTLHNIEFIISCLNVLY